MDEVRFSSEKIIEACRRLGIEDGQTLRDVKRAYRRLAALLHPDVCTEPPEACAARFRALKRDYDLLLSLCETYPIRFSADKRRDDPEYDHIMRFYDGWLGDIPKKR
jgi:hypothetical protein